MPVATKFRYSLLGKIIDFFFLRRLGTQLEKKRKACKQRNLTRW